MGTKGAAKEEQKNEVEPPVEDENQLYIGKKCQCRWKSMKGAYYNCVVRQRNASGSYAMDYEDGDADDDVEVDRILNEEWKPSKQSNAIGYGYNRGPSELEKGFHTTIVDGRITVECLHRVAKTTSSYYSNTPQKELTQWPLILSMRKQIQGDELHTLVWEQLKRFVAVDSEWNRHNLPYVLRIDEQYSCATTKKAPIEDVSKAIAIEEKQCIVVDWSPEGMKTGYDNSSFERRDDHESMPSRSSKSGNKNNLSLSKCFHEMAKEEQLGENDKWHCRECRAADREPFRRAFKKMTVYKTGEILVLHLKRFVFESGFSASFVHREKIESTVSYPVNGLDLTGVVQDPSGPPPIYDLFAVSNHSGGLGE